MATPASARLLMLPVELQLCIFDIIFQQIVDQSKATKDSHVYMLPFEMPKLGTGIYRALLLICKQIKEEAEKHFHKHYMPKVKFSFDNTPQLYDLAQHVATIPAHRSPRFALYSRRRCYYDFDDDGAKPQLAGRGLLRAAYNAHQDVRHCMLQHFKRGHYYSWATGMFRSVGQIRRQEERLVPGSHFTQHNRNDTAVNHSRALEDAVCATGITIGEDRDSEYTLMTGLVKYVRWTGYDAEKARGNYGTNRDHCASHIRKGCTFVDRSADMGILFGEAPRKTLPAKEAE